MNNAGTPYRWLQGWRAKWRPAQADPADLGTAFGLDASFGDIPCADQPAPAPPKPGWMKRLSTRARLVI